MDLEDNQISFICPNLVSYYSPGELVLPLVFYVDHGKTLPEEVVFHFPTSATWSGKVVEGGKRVIELEEMMKFYGIKPYHLALLQYAGAGHFKIQLYSPYAVELKYPIQQQTSSPSLRCNDIELQKLGCMFSYNAIHNFSGVYHLVIEEKHLFGGFYNPVLSSNACQKLHLNESCKSVKLGFETKFWNVSIQWKNGEIYFSKQWLDFVKAAELLPGDSLSFFKSKTDLTFQVCVFHVRAGYNDVDDGGAHGLTSYFKFFKVITKSVLKDGELEIPHIFVAKYGKKLTNVLNIFLGGGMSTTFKYCHEKNSIYGLHRFLGKYCVEEDYVVFFNYIGYSNFTVSVYDSQWMNHLRDEVGTYRLKEFTGPVCDEDLVHIPDSSDSGSDMRSDRVSEENEDDSDDSEIDEIFTFEVVLKTSHVHQNCHGAYISKNLSSIYMTWGKRTMTTLFFRGHEWNVDALRKKRTCRFGIGWDEFIDKNNLVANEVLLFEYLGDYSFQVRTVG